jgi:hypothetical protein
MNSRTPPFFAAIFGIATLVPLHTMAQVTQDSIGKMKFTGTSTPQGSPPWNVKINFGTGDATWSKAGGASAKRRLSSYTVAGNKLSLKLHAVSPVGIPDLICDGTISGNLIDAQCHPNAGMPPEKLVGSLSED